MSPTQHSEKFTLNNKTYSKQDLLTLANEVLSSDKNNEEKSIFQFIKEWFNDNPYIQAKTSGSTGEPKNIRLLKSSMQNSALRTINYFELKKGNNLLLCLPSEYIAGKMMIVRAFAGSMNLITAEPSANPFENLNCKIDFAALTPYQLENSFKTLKKKNIAKKIILGGAPVPYQLLKSIPELNAEVFETYGMTETCSHIAVKNLSEKERQFKILEGVNITKNENNCLVIKDKLTCSETLTTNDIVELSGKGSFTWLGRLDNIINSGGIKLSPENIEQKLHAHLPWPIMIAGFPDDSLGEKIILLIESEKPVNESDVFNIAQSTLEKYEQPKKIIVLPTFNYTSNGKINRRLTRKQAIDNFIS